MRYIAVLLTAILSLCCAANAGGIWGEPAEIAPIQTTGSSNDLLVGQANVTRPSAASRSKTNGLRSGGTVSGPSLRPASQPHTVHAPSTPTSAATPVNAAYRIGPLDVIDISVFQAPELSKTVEVSEDGDIDLPVLGVTPAAGKTARELQQDIDSRLRAKYLQNPQVTVTVKESNSGRVTVSGAVKRPGVFPYKGQSLFEYVTMAGGLAFEANSTVIVLRDINGKRSATKFNVADIQAGHAPDPPVQAGDLIVADSSSLKTGYNALLKMLPIQGAAQTGVGLAR